ncbi:Protein YceI [Alphaproteobacteria bacterium SO-S41]|nr:Protein YceI [Alphaproteobacteria bacterium SO-S41]
MFKPLAALAATASVLVLPVAAAPRIFIVDGHNAKLTFNCAVLGMMDVEGAFTRFVAMVAIDESAPGEARTVVRVDAGSLTTDETDWIEDLKGPDFFDVTRYPLFDFNSFGAEVVSPGVLRVSGTLTLKGISRPVTLKVRYRLPDAAGGAAHLQAQGELDRTEFGMDAYDLVLSDDVEIDVTGSLAGYGQ